MRSAIDAMASGPGHMTGGMISDGWMRPALIGVGLVTLARVVLLAFNRTDLFVDEAQYWLWGQDLAFGYYSKPPMIGWVLRVFSEIGQDAAFWIRLPGPLFHGATALILGALAARIFNERMGVLAALGYVTLPMVAVGSLLISTDTIMFPFLAGALLIYFGLLQRPSVAMAALCGALLGLAFLSKYAAIYFPICAMLAAIAALRARPGWKQAAIITAAFLVAASPNLIWNLANGLTTVQHTLDNADWVRDPAARAGLNFAGLAEFFGAQFAVLGPVLFAALLFAGATWRRRTADERLLLVFCLPIVALVCVQALLSQAYANWAASAYLAGAILALWILSSNKLFLIASFSVNGALCVLFPVATLAPEFLSRDGQPLLNRYIGRADMSASIFAHAHAEGVSKIVASNRDVLADLFYSGRGTHFKIFAVRTKGRAPHHYALRFPYEPVDERIFYVAPTREDVPCQGIEKGILLQPETGAYHEDPQIIFVTTGLCLKH